jgi:methanogenic corrinoid protein MtbC1
MWRTDVQARLGQLAQAVCVGRPELFVASTAWSKAAFAARDVDVDDLRLSLACTGEVVREKLPPAIGTVAGAIVDEAIARLDDLPDTVPCAIDVAARHADLSRRYLRLLLESRRDDALELVLSALRSGASFEEICLRVLCPAMREVGRLWHVNEIGVAEEHCCTAATGMVLGQAFAFARGQRRTAPNGRVALVTSVGGDLHELGARMVSDFLELAGWQAIFLGANTPPEDVVEAVAMRKPDLLCISANSNLSVGAVKRLVQRLRAAPEASGVRIIVGGAPFAAIEDLWREVGADGWAKDGAEAVELAARLVGPKVA